jgi:hypothetical protein
MVRVDDFITNMEIRIGKAHKQAPSGRRVRGKKRRELVLLLICYS